jgi:hypothetical protein
MSEQPPDLAVLLLRDALARVTRIADYVQDGEIREATLGLEDLAVDLWKFLAALEEAA